MAWCQKTNQSKNKMKQKTTKDSIRQALCSLWAQLTHLVAVLAWTSEQNFPKQKISNLQTIPRKMLGRKTCNKLNLGMQFQLVERHVNSTCQSSLLVEKVRTFIALSLNLWVLHCRRDIFIYCSVFSVFHSTLWNIFALWVPERHR